MKRFIFVSASLLILAGCQKGGSSGSTMNRFKQLPTSNFQDGAVLSNGDYAKYEIRVDNSAANFAVEVRNQGQCSHGSGMIPVDLIGGIDVNAQDYELTNLKVQIQPKDNGQLKYNDQFVHLIVDRNAEINCSGAVGKQVADADFRTQQQRHFFSDFGLNQSQLDMAGPTLVRGSSTFMLYFKSPDLGLAFDSLTGDLIGVDVPKDKLVSPYTFTTGRAAFNAPNGELFPLMMTPEDLSTFRRTSNLVREIKSAVELTKDKPLEERQRLINGTWWNYFSKQENQL